MPKIYKSNIAFMPVVESISRKFALRKETCTKKYVGDKMIKTDGYMGSGTTNRLVQGYGWVRKNYFFMRKNARSTPITADEQVNRGFFSQTSKWNPMVWKDLSVLTENYEKWDDACADYSKTIKGISAKGYTNPRTWSFAIGMAILADGQTLPSNHALPSFDA